MRYFLLVVVVVGSGRHKKRGNDVDPNAHACKYYQKNGNQANDCGVNAEVFGNTAAYAADLPIGSGFVKSTHDFVSFFLFDSELLVFLSMMQAYQSRMKGALSKD